MPSTTLGGGGAFAKQRSAGADFALSLQSQPAHKSSQAVEMRFDPDMTYPTLTSVKPPSPSLPDVSHAAPNFSNLSNGTHAAAPPTDSDCNLNLIKSPQPVATFPVPCYQTEKSRSRQSAKTSACARFFTFLLKLAATAIASIIMLLALAFHFSDPEIRAAMEMSTHKYRYTY